MKRSEGSINFGASNKKKKKKENSLSYCKGARVSNQLVITLRRIVTMFAQKELLSLAQCGNTYGRKVSGDHPRGCWGLDGYRPYPS
ncbi:hypothetical protein EMCRGX_G004246 [Ephydatia muelleri]